GRREGAIVEVLERARKRLVGRLHRDRNFLIVTPADRRIAHGVLVAQKDAKGAESGQVVVVELLEHPSVEPVADAYRPPVGRVTEVLGSATDPGMEIEIALRKHDLPFEFSPKARAQAAKLPDEVR